jgi:hypothetical protein
MDSHASRAAQINTPPVAERNSHTPHSKDEKMLRGESDPLAEDQDNNELEEVPIRVEPLVQQTASTSDVEKGLKLIQVCRDGDFEFAKKMIARQGFPAGFITKTGWTPLGAAAYSGNAPLVLYLLEIGADHSCEESCCCRWYQHTTPLGLLSWPRRDCVHSDSSRL